MKQYNSHYDWLNENFNAFTKALGIEHDLNGLIVAHGDKCYGYQNEWKKAGVPFEHGVAMYLLSYIHPYSKTVRETTNGWVNPKTWVIEQYPKLKHALPKAYSL